MDKLDMYVGISAITGELRAQLLDFSVDHVTLERDAATMTVLLLDHLDRLLEGAGGRT